MAEVSKPADQPEGAETPSEDDVKARFKEALEAKQGRHKNERLHPEGDSGLHDTHGRSGGKRQFRRKSGG